jgi:tRNA-dihydrouridine synthase
MIGRAAIANPWIFSGLDRNEVPQSQVRATMGEHLRRMLSFYGAKRGLVMFRKYAKGYLKPYNLPRAIFLTLLTTEDVAEFLSLLDSILL